MALRKRLLLAIALLLFLIGISTTGYRLIGGPSVSFLQALYMAVITLAGVGYGEVVDTSHNPALRVFNIGIVLFGVAITVYVFSVVAAFLVEVEFSNPFWRRRMQRHIDELTGHHIVCGLGDTGRHAVAELQKTNTPHVVVDLSEENIKKLMELHSEALGEMLFVVGDATEEDVLEKAGLSRAKGLIAALPLDKDNLVVTVIVRQRFPKMRIVARSAERKFSERMLRAGANSTVSPSHIGGLRMAQRTDPSACSRIPRYHAERAGQNAAGGGDRGQVNFPVGRKRSAGTESQGTLHLTGAWTETPAGGRLLRFAHQSTGQLDFGQRANHHRDG